MWKLKSIIKTALERLQGIKPLQKNVQNKENSLGSYNLNDIERVHGTPFTVVKVPTVKEAQNSFIAIGNARITNLMTGKECMGMILNKDWNLIVSAIDIIATNLQNMKPVNQEEPKEKE